MDPKRLRQETRHEHEATEALLPLGHAGLTVAEYRAGLCALYAVVQSWESWAEQWSPAQLSEVVRVRRRGQLLRADLEQLGVPPRDLPAAAKVNWEEVTGAKRDGEGKAGGEISIAGFLGALYVMEGSTLGGRFLAKHVRDTLGETYAPMTQYFNGHGAGTGAMWREVTELLEGVPEELAPVTTAAARRSFAAFGQVLRSELQLSVPSEY